jgi:membrane-bound ClpP family serine protease
VEPLLDEPATILVALTLAAVLLVVEAALPTVGIAGTLALLLSAVAVIGITRQDATWWPLLGPAVAVVLWCVMVALRRRSATGQAFAAALFGGGSVAFGAMADSPTTVVIGILAAVALAGGFPSVHGAAERLFGRPSQVGMDSMVGSIGEVTAWKGQAGTVVLDGSRWNATARRPVHKGAQVTVVAFSGMTVEVAPTSDDLKGEEP